MRISVMLHAPSSFILLFWVGGVGLGGEEC